MTKEATALVEQLVARLQSRGLHIRDWGASPAEPLAVSLYVDASDIEDPGALAGPLLLAHEAEFARTQGLPLAWISVFARDPGGGNRLLYGQAIEGSMQPSSPSPALPTSALQSKLTVAAGPAAARAGLKLGQVDVREGESGRFVVMDATVASVAQSACGAFIDDVVETTRQLNAHDAATVALLLVRVDDGSGNAVVRACEDFGGSRGFWAAPGLEKQEALRPDWAR